MVAHEEKEKVIGDYFKNHIGSAVPRTTTINCQSLGYTQHDLSDMEVPFSHDEVKNTINSMPSDKASGPDGFTGAFFKACWKIIKEDVMAAIKQPIHIKRPGF